MGQGLAALAHREEKLEALLVDMFAGAARRLVANLSVEGHRQYNPGWHLALDLANMLVVSECIAKAALEREESRGGHTRDDFPGPDDRWGALNLVLTLPPGSDEVDLRHQPLPAMPEDLKKLFDQ